MRKLLIVLGVMVLAVLIGSLVPSWRSRSSIEPLSALLDDRIATYAKRRWVRPVLRGETLDGNAATAADEAIRKLEMPDEECIPGVLAATHHTFAYTVQDLDKGFAAPVPDHAKHLTAAKFLVERAQARGTGCLRAAADATRLMQDVAPGAGLTGQMFAAAGIRAIVPLAAKCLPSASVDEKKEGAAEFALLATNAPPLAWALEAESLAVSSLLRDIARRAPAIPTSVEGMELLWGLPPKIVAWSFLSAEYPDWAALAGERYPAIIEFVRTRMATRISTRNGVMLDAADLTRYAVKDAEAQALLRAFAVLLDELGNTPTAALVADARMQDPFTTAPLRVVYDAAGAATGVHSVGPNLKDDAGGDDDIGVTVPP